MTPPRRPARRRVRVRPTLVPAAPALLALLLGACTGRGENRATTGTDYAPVIEALRPFIQAEVDQKGLPALSIALVDDQDLVWAEGFGLEDPDAGTPATAETVYRVGSVSKLFTDIGVMQLVEARALDLDAPVTTVLPDFRPRNPFGGEITLRQLMSHRAGLVREPPVGHYFDPTEPSLQATVESLNGTTLVYPPESRHKYSNAGVAVVGYVLEHSRGEAFAPYLARSVLEPMGMSGSGFEPDEGIRRHLAKAVMWSYDGREFPAPTFELGMSPAGSMYAPVTDLARFLSVLFAGGRGPEGQVLSAASLDTMWTPQFDDPGATTGRGLGFGISRLDGHRQVGHGGAIYGFSTELAALPDDRLGVAVATTRDFSNSVTGRIAREALRLMLAHKESRRLITPDRTTPVEPSLARELAGRYRTGEAGVDIEERDGRVYVTPADGGYRVEVRALGDDLVADDRMSFGTRLVRGDGSVTLGGSTFPRVDDPLPPAAPPRFRGLIGEYGWDHDILFVFERDGRLWALIEWLELDPLEEVGEDEFLFPRDRGLYHGEGITFVRDASGRATVAVTAGIPFQRRHGAADGETFRIQPLHPADELRETARAATPPPESGDLEQPDLVELIELDPTIRLDIRYAGTNNFMSAPFYRQARAFMQRPAAEAVVRAHRRLQELGYGLLIHDAYRPWYVTKMFWDATPDSMKIFVANPDDGSRHNRGAAVDLTLFDRATGDPVTMTGGYDEFSERSYPSYMGGTSRQRWHRELLRRVMEEEGFTVYQYEWWHFDYRGWERFPIMNATFEELEAGGT